MSRPVTESIEYDNMLLETLQGWVKLETVESALSRLAGPGSDKYRVWVRTQSGCDHALLDMYESDERARLEAHALMRQVRNPTWG